MQKKNQLSNNVFIPSLILGSYQVDSQEEMDIMVRSCLKNGCYGFDTSPSYGTEKILGESIHKACLHTNITRKELFITDKVDGIQMCLFNGAVEPIVEESLRKMGLNYFDLLLVHWPFMDYLKATWEHMENMLRNGTVKAIGLSNVNKRIYNNFLKLNPNIEPHVIQNEITPLNTAEKDVEFFQERNIMVEAYSSLCRMIPDITKSSTILEISEKYNKSIPQIILRWNYQRNIIPIFKSKSEKRIQENLSIFDFNLSDDDMMKINNMDKRYKIFPESYGSPGC